MKNNIGISCKMTASRAGAAIVLFLGLVSCTPALLIPEGPASAEPTQPPTPTSTPLPPTFTPSPTATLTPTPSPTPTLTPTPAPINLTGAGDIAVCGQEGDDHTAALLDQIQGEIFTAGDNSNEAGTTYQFTECFGPSWGRHKERIHPSPGNHDYMTPGAPDYYAYFGPAAGEPGKGYYSYDLGDWHIVALNSNCNHLACGPDSEQVAWLRADLEAHPSRCTLAYWHHPRFSSGLAGGSGLYGFWQVLYEHGAEIVVNGHDHDYERFAPQDPDGNPDPQRGIRQFLAGTGGASQRGQGEIMANSEIFHTGTYGVLKFTLYPDHYDWEFVPVAGESFTDSGSTPCHE